MFKASRSLIFILKWKKIGVHSEIHGWLSRKTLTDRAKIAIYDTLGQMWAFDWHIYIWPWSILKAKVTHNARFYCEYLVNSNIFPVEMTGLILLLPQNRKLHMGWRLWYLHLTLTHSKDQDEGHICRKHTWNIQSVAFNRLSTHTLPFLRLTVQLQVEKRWMEVAVET